MTAPQGVRLPCPYCTGLLYSTNKHGVCSTNPKCRAVYNFISRHRNVTVSMVPNPPDSCPSCGVKMTFRSNLDPATASIDKVIPALGYVKGNISWLCMRCNRLKGNASLNELRNIVAYMERALNERTTDTIHRH